MKILKRKKNIILPLVLIFLVIVSFREGVICPIGYCSDGIICVSCEESETKGKAIGSLVNPPNSSTELKFAGNQAINIELTNHNLLFAPVTVNCNYQNPPNTAWNVLLGPNGSNSKSYSVFGTVPIGWKITASTNADAVAVSIKATWDKWD